MCAKADPEKDEYRQQRDTIYTYFYYSNKPVQLAEIFLQFKNYKKPAVEKILNDLVGKNKIFTKSIGKTKFYCLAQDMVYTIDDKAYTDEIDKKQDQNTEDKTLRYLKWKYSLVNEQFNKLKDQSRVIESRLQELSNEMSIDELKTAILNMKKYLENNKDIESQEVVDTKEFEKQKKIHTTLKKEAASRNSIFKEIVENICEGVNCKKKQLLEDAGIEDL